MAVIYMYTQMYAYAHFTLSTSPHSHSFTAAQILLVLDFIIGISHP